MTIFSIAFNILTHPWEQYTKLTNTLQQLKAIIFLIKDNICSFIFVRHWYSIGAIKLVMTPLSTFEASNLRDRAARIRDSRNDLSNWKNIIICHKLHLAISLSILQNFSWS